MEKGGNSGNIGARKPILALGELLVDLVPGREGMRIEDAGPVVKTASGSAGISPAPPRCWADGAASSAKWGATASAGW